MTDKLTVIGGGLAGCEAAWQAASRGLDVALVEMRPLRGTGAHQSADLAELVCSNSLGSTLPDRAAGALKRELERLGSLLLSCARETAVPAGEALAVDRTLFAQMVTQKIESHPRITVERREALDIPMGPVIIASGPLTSPALSESIGRLIGRSNLFFYDAVAPILAADSINDSIAFFKARHNKPADYLNCPMNDEEYKRFVEALCTAEQIPLREFESDIPSGVRAGKSPFFEGCLPIEMLARRGKDTLAYGPLRPVGLHEPRTGRRPYAVVQLRQEDVGRTMYNMVGFQTNLREAEQRRVFRMIPGLERAEFIRHGQMHRNTFLFAPQALLPTLQFRTRPDLFFAGQIAGVEGYAGNIATGLLAGWNAVRVVAGKLPLQLPPDTLTGALCSYICSADELLFQPMKTNFGIVPPLAKPLRKKPERAAAYSRRAAESLERWLAEVKDAGE